MNNAKIIKKTCFVILYCLFCILAILLIFEFIYRQQIIDTYLPELQTFNKEITLKDKTKKTILVFGDSFTGGKINFPGIMQKQLPGYRIINSGIPGSGIIESLIIAQKRFKIFEPDIFIYQIYAGNDLFNISYTVNWQKLSFIRNLYWSIAERFRFLSFLNYRLGQIKQSIIHNSSKKTIKNKIPLQKARMMRTRTFTIRNYDKNARLYFKAEPEILENHILVKGKRKRDFNILLAKLEKLISFCQAGTCKAYILIIPHPCQINKQYFENIKLAGAQFEHPELIQNNEYPFVTKIRKKFKNKPDICVLNPIKIFKEYEDNNKPLYYINNAHLNPEGQNVIAEFLIDNISL